MKVENMILKNQKNCMLIIINLKDVGLIKEKQFINNLKIIKKWDIIPKNIDFYIHLKHYMYIKVKMKNIEILKKYIEKNNGLLFSAEVKNINIHKQYIKLLCDEGYIERKRCICKKRKKCK